MTNKKEKTHWDEMKRKNPEKKSGSNQIWQRHNSNRDSADEKRGRK